MVRLAVIQDIDAILEILSLATIDMQKDGIYQWIIGGYPGRSEVKHDIDCEQGYVCEIEGVVVGYSAVIGDGEPTYSEICGGQWLTDKPYYTIHRIAVHRDSKCKGVARQIFDYVSSMATATGRNVRIDTHRVNTPMRSLLKKLGYQYCGIIHIYDGSERVAYELDCI